MLRSAAILMLVLVPACRPTALAGESLGQYRVEGSLEENACGDGHPGPAAFAFYVELRSEPGSSVGYWKLPDAGLVGGTVHADGRFRFEQRLRLRALDPDPVAGTSGCELDRVEVVEGALEPPDASDAGVSEDAARLRATTRIAVWPVAGGHCTPLLALNGGAFPTLPCELRYRLEGRELDEPLW